MGKFVTRDYLITQFENYDNEVAKPRSQAGITVDSAISSTSENPVQNKVIKTALDAKQNTLTAGTGIDITNNVISTSSSYSLPTASTTVLGGVKIDGTTITISNGVISSSGSGGTDVEGNPSGTATAGDLTKLRIGSDIYDVPGTEYTLPTASTTTLGGVKIDGETITIADGVISSTGGGVVETLSYDETLDILGLPANPIYKYRIATPVMTSNTTPSGVASASSEHSNTTAAWTAFKQADVNEGWATSYGQITNQWIQYKFDDPKVIEKLNITLRDIVSYGMFKAFDFQASNNGTDWTTLLSANNIVNTPGSSYDYNIDNDDAYYYYRIFITDIGGYTSDHIGLKRFDMYEKYLV